MQHYNSTVVYDEHLSQHHTCDDVKIAAATRVNIRKIVNENRSVRARAMGRKLSSTGEILRRERIEIEMEEEPSNGYGERA